MKKMNWGIIGCGNIANKFAADLSLIEAANLMAVASRSLKNAEVFAKKHHVIKSYDSYEKLLKDTDIDIVYIATPHTSHAALSIKAMQHGKHVLCEKPLALNKKETEQIIATSKSTNCFFMEALWSRFNPSFIEILKRIESGEIGEVKYINADFSFLVDAPLDGRVLNLELGGGALLDIGIYPAFLTYSILGIPKNILATTHFHPITKCDMQTSMIFNHLNAQANLSCSFDSDVEIKAKIIGTKGKIYLDDTWISADGFTIVKNEQETYISLPKKGLGYTHEILECQKCIAENKTESDLWSHRNSLELIGILDSVRNQVGLKYPQEKS